jgi:Contractile injection system tube protein
MLASAQLAKAELRQLDANFENEIGSDNWTKVQFNPDTLKVTFANQLVTPSGPGDQRGSPARQFVGAGTTKLTVTLVFDVTAPLAEGQDPVDDVRKLTQKVAFYITPQKTDEEPPKYIPPAVRFLWGSFQFDGLMESMEESLELFSSDGKPQRAVVALSMSQQKIQEFAFRDTGAGPGAGLPGGGAPGTRPLSQAFSGATLQGMVSTQAGGASWQAVASANGIENPRQLQPGQLVNLNVKASLNL